MRAIRKVAVLAVLAICPAAAAQINQPSFGNMPNNQGFQQNSPLGSGGSFRPNNSSFGSPLGLQTPSAGVGTNPFEQARADPQEQSRAISGTATSSTSAGRGGQRARAAGQRTGQPGAGFGRQGARFNQGQFGQGGFGRQAGMGAFSRPQIVTRFEYSAVTVPPAQIVAAARTSLTPQTVPGLTGLGVRFDNGVAVLEGEVATARDAQLAAAILSLEPGVRSVDNRLTIQSLE